jgi:hypothetical protein
MAVLFTLSLKTGFHSGGLPRPFGRRLDLPVRSIALDDAAAEHFGALAMPVRGNGPVSNLQTSERFRWKPRELDLIADIDQNYPA